MPIKFIDCFVVSTDVKHDAYNKKDPNSSQGLEQQRVKIKTTQVRDCRRVAVQNEEQEQSEEGEEEQELLADEEEQKINEKEPTMQTLMEVWRRFQQTA